MFKNKFNLYFLLIIIISFFLTGCASQGTFHNKQYTKDKQKLNNKKIAVLSLLNHELSEKFSYKLTYFLNTKKNIQLLKPEISKQYSEKYKFALKKITKNKDPLIIKDQKLSYLLDTIQADYILVTWLSSVPSENKKNTNKKQINIYYYTLCNGILINCKTKEKVSYSYYKSNYSKSKICCMSSIIRVIRNIAGLTI